MTKQREPRRRAPSGWRLVFALAIVAGVGACGAETAYNLHGTSTASSVAGAQGASGVHARLRPAAYADDALGPTPVTVPVSPSPLAQPVYAPPISGARVVVPILLYHYVRSVNPVLDKVGYGLSVSPSNFAAQMKLIHDSGTHTVSLADVMSAMSGGPALPPHSVVLTFDDGYVDFATTAVPVMQQYGLHATEFVVPGFLNHPGYLTTAQLAQVQTSGMTIGAHTLHHVALAHTSLANARAEIVGSLQQLQSLTGTQVPDFAYPYGDYNLLIAQLVKDAGFRDAVTTNEGNVQFASQRFELRRIRVGGYDSLATFARKVGIPSTSYPSAPTPTPAATPAPTPTPSSAATPTPTPDPSATPSPSAATAPAAAGVRLRTTR